MRQQRSRPHVEAFRSWGENQLARIPAKGDLAKAVRYALNRWPAFTLFLEDGRVAIDNNPAERAIRPLAIGRKNWLFAGSDAGGKTLADAMTIIETAKLSGHNPEAYLADVLARVAEMLGEDEDLLYEISIEMEPEDGVIHVYATDDDGITAFTDFGIESLRELLQIYRQNAAQDQAAPVNPPLKRS